MATRKILIVYDVPGWIWHRNAQQIQKNLPQYDIDILPKKNVNDKVIERYDHTHFCGWELGLRWAEYVSAGACSHNFETKQAKLARENLSRFKKLTANSRKIESGVRQFNSHVYYAANGVDEELFQPLPYPESGKFVVGWTGKIVDESAGFPSESDKVDYKGYNIILKPLIDYMKDEDVKFKLLAGNYKSCVPHDKMPLFFSDVGCQLCVSLLEGTPNPMFEAAACARPLISTDVGAISEFIDNSTGFNVGGYRSQKKVKTIVERVYASIMILKKDRNMGKWMGQNARNKIEEGWTWKQRAKQFIPVFEE